MAEAVMAKAGTILVVHKRLPPLKEIVRTLRVANFVVLEAHSEGKAINFAANHAESIDLLLADSELLGWSHSSIVTVLRQQRPDLQVMLLCGEIVVGSFGCAVIQNPFIPVKFVEIINAVLHPAEESQSAQRATSAA